MILKFFLKKIEKSKLTYQTCDSDYEIRIKKSLKNKLKKLILERKKTI
jgi:hypothetical protein